MSKLVTADLKHLLNWLNANESPCNVKKLKLWSLNLSKRNLKIIWRLDYLVKDYIPQKVSNSCELKLKHISVGNVKLTIFVLNWLEPMFSFLK